MLSSYHAKNLRKQFGEQCFNIMLLSPTIMKNLEEIKRLKIKIRLLGGVCAAYYDGDKKTIYVGRWCSKVYKATSIAHEYVHAVTYPTNNPEEGENREEFIQRCLWAETYAVINEIKATKELIKAKIQVESKLLAWLKIYRRGGKNAIFKSMHTAITSTTKEQYYAYYGLWYDEVANKIKRQIGELV